MRATVSLDDDLLRTAEEYTGLTERAALIRAALKVADCAGSRPQASGAGRDRPQH